MKITLVGMGMGNPDTLTRAAWSALEQAQRMIGARRLLEALPPHFGGLRYRVLQRREKSDRSFAGKGL